MQWLERQAAHIGIRELHHARMRWRARLLSAFHQRPCQLINVGLHKDVNADQQTLCSGLYQCLSMHRWRAMPETTHSKQGIQNQMRQTAVSWAIYYGTAARVTLWVVWMVSIGMKSSSSYLLRLLRTMA